MSYLLDSDIISLAHKKYLPAKLERWLRANEADCFISALTIAEMRHGVDLAPESHKAILEKRVLETESQFAEAIEPVSLDCLVQWKRVAAFLKSEKRTISCEDSLLAAQCLATGHVMVTHNTAHFELLAPLGLQVEDPLA